LTGNSASNRLSGNAGADKLLGGLGNDTLIGGIGKDNLTGGAGADKFKFNSIAETGKKATTRDTISDFKHSQGDKIDLSAIDADTVVAGNNAFTSLTVGNAFSGSFANRSDLYFDKTAHILYGNNDADATADFSILLSGVTTLSKTDFVL
jgi:Ca2+-binding RTX toxin-like protein